MSNKALTDSELNLKIIDIFCNIYGEKYRLIVDSETSMDDIDEWDSLSFLDFVMELEDEFDIEFSDEEASQMFQIGHINRIVKAAVLDIPHEDVAHACCNIHCLKNAPKAHKSLILFSGSSTREGLIDEAEGQRLLRQRYGEQWNWYNCSVSGLVAAETLQLLEQVEGGWDGAVLIGTSPIILGGCGVMEFERAINLSRFPFASTNMSQILEKYDYIPEGEKYVKPMDMNSWAERYLKGRDIDSLRYNPYLYPTLEPWVTEKYSDPESINRFYYNAIFNYEESTKINTLFYDEFWKWSKKTGIPVIFVELTLHSKTANYLEEIGGMISSYNTFINQFLKKTGMPYINAVKDAGITDVDFRDPAHIFKRREIYTKVVLDGISEFI